MKSITGPLFQQTLYYNDSRSNGTNLSCHNCIVMMEMEIWWKIWIRELVELNIIS